MTDTTDRTNKIQPLSPSQLRDNGEVTMATEGSYKVKYSQDNAVFVIDDGRASATNGTIPDRYRNSDGSNGNKISDRQLPDSQMSGGPRNFW